MVVQWIHKVTMYGYKASSQALMGCIGQVHKCRDNVIHEVRTFEILK